MIYIRAFLSLLSSCIKACAILGFFFGLFVGIAFWIGGEKDISIILAPFGIGFIACLFGPFLAFPVILFSAPICVHLAKRPIPHLSNFIIASTLLSAAYAVVLRQLNSFDFFVIWFIAAGPLVGWLAWRDRAFYLTTKKAESESAA